MKQPPDQRAAQVANTLNHGCFCFDLAPDGLSRALESALGSTELADEVRERAPHLFARQPVFVHAAQLQRIADVVPYVFVLDEADGVHPLPHALYLSLARGEATAPGWAGATVRLADWYVRLKDDEPDSVANETYSLMSFDAEGRVDCLGPRRPILIEPASSGSARTPPGRRPRNESR